MGYIFKIFKNAFSVLFQVALVIAILVVTAVVFNVAMEWIFTFIFGPQYAE